MQKARQSVKRIAGLFPLFGSPQALAAQAAAALPAGCTSRSGRSRGRGRRLCAPKGAKAKAAEELSEQLRAQLADAANDADRIRNEAAAAAKAQADNVLKEAGEQADRIVSEAKERAEAEREEVLSSLRSDIASSAEAIAGKILERKVSDEDTKRIAEEFFREAESGGVAK